MAMIMKKKAWMITTVVLELQPIPQPQTTLVLSVKNEQHHHHQRTLQRKKKHHRE